MKTPLNSFLAMKEAGCRIKLKEQMVPIYTSTVQLKSVSDWIISKYVIMHNK